MTFLKVDLEWNFGLMLLEVFSKSIISLVEKWMEREKDGRDGEGISREEGKESDIL